jgi:hypothetical protein
VDLLEGGLLQEWMQGKYSEIQLTQTIYYQELMDRNQSEEDVEFPVIPLDLVGYGDESVRHS